MSQYDNTNRGSIWKNDKKERDTHPDFKGSLNVEGIEYWVSAWRRKPDANPNAPALSFSVQPKDQQSQQQSQQRPAPQQQRQPAQQQRQTEPRQQAPAGQFDDFYDDIPF